jgi:hypothetical protein
LSDRVRKTAPKALSYLLYLVTTPEPRHDQPEIASAL